MHRRLFSILSVLLACCFCAAGQDAYQDVRQDTRKAGNIYYVSDFADRDLTPAPKGYKPFYISTYQRHGARYILEESFYDKIRNTLDEAESERNLTPEGKKLRERFLAVYPSLKGRGGELTPMGARQMRTLAERLYSNYPKVFRRKGAHIEAFGSSLNRTMLSMNAFCEALKEKRPDLDIRQESSYADLPFLNPHSGNSPYTTSFDKRNRSEAGDWHRPYVEYCNRKLDVNAFISRYFLNPSKVSGKLDFMQKLFDFAGDGQCLDEDPGFYDLFTQDEILALWECDNLKYYIWKGKSDESYGLPWKATWSMLDDIITKADQDMADGTAARLRFGHDGCIMSMFCLMGIDGWAYKAPDFDSVKETWKSYEVPMAANVQMIFYKNKKDDVIFKMLFNEKDMKLPLESVSGPYYRWSDFKEHYIPVVAAARKDREASPEPVVLTGSVTCEGQPLEGVHVSDGVRIVKTGKDGRYRMYSDKRQGFVFITTPSGYVATSRDGLRPDFYANLTEPLGVPEEHDFTLKKENQDTYSILYFTDAHLTNADFKPDLREFRETAMPNIRKQAERLSALGPVYTLNLGDLAHELYWYTYDFNLKDAVNTLLENHYPTLMYSVSGNHDNDGAIHTDNTDRDAEHLYREVLGPEYYSMNIGGEHWIMMDDILYVNVPGKGKKSKGIVGDRSYGKGFTKDQMAWLKADLKDLPDNARIRLCLHAPIVTGDEKGTMFDRTSQVDSIAALFARFGTVDVACGHVHRMQFIDSEKWPVFKEMEVPAISGDMWTTTPVTVLGIDGEEAGVVSATFSRDGSCDYVYSTHRFGEKWMRIYDMNSVMSYYAKDKDIRAQMKTYPDRTDYADKRFRNFIYVNCWYLRPGWTVEILENGKPLEVNMVSDEDPLFNVNKYLPSFINKPVFNDKYERIINRHMFSAKARTARGRVLVRVKDAEGNVIREETLTRPKAFSPDME